MATTDWNPIKLFRSSLCLRLFIIVVVVANVESQKPPEQAILEKMFRDGGYDRRVRPLNGGNASVLNDPQLDPVMVLVNFYLRRVDRVDDNDHEFSIQLTFRQKWKDTRLSYSASGSTNHVSLLNPQNQIWRPDTFFSNEREGRYHDIMSRNEFVRINPNGDILQSARISLRLACPMNFRKFPLDQQVCSMRLASYGYTTNDVKYQWEKDNPVQLSQNLVIPKFLLDGMVTSYCDSITSTGSYSCLRVDFTFKRFFKHYLIHVYIPSTMMTIVSWLPFWISIQAVTARAVLSTLTLFVLSIQTAEVNKTFPVTSYTKAVDTWTGICLTFVFASLLEFIIVQYIARRNERNSSNSSKSAGQLLDATLVGSEANAGQEQEIPLKDIESPGDDVQKENQGDGSSAKPNVTQKVKNAAKTYISEFDSLPEKIDGVCRIIFPILFVIFNIIYWPVALA